MLTDPSTQTVKRRLKSSQGETPDISEYLDFEFHDGVLYGGNAGLGEVE